MHYIVLDTNIILRYPRLLGVPTIDINYLVPQDVIEELKIRDTKSNIAGGKRIKLIEEAVREGKITIVNTDLPAFNKYASSINEATLTGADISIIATALTFRERGERVTIATYDKSIQKYSLQYGIPFLASNELDNLLKEFSSSNDHKKLIYKKIISYENAVKWTFTFSVLFSTVLTTVAIPLYTNINFIISKISVGGTVVLILISGIALYILREKQRLIYGLFEFFIGAYTIITFFQPFDFHLLSINYDTEFSLKLLGGLYIMVRGQDNIVKALKDTKPGLYLKDKLGIGK